MALTTMSGSLIWAWTDQAVIRNGPNKHKKCFFVGASLFATGRADVASKLAPTVLIIQFGFTAADPGGGGRSPPPSA